LIKFTPGNYSHDHPHKSAQKNCFFGTGSSLLVRGYGQFKVGSKPRLTSSMPSSSRNDLACAALRALVCSAASGRRIARRPRRIGEDRGCQSRWMRHFRRGGSETGWRHCGNGLRSSGRRFPGGRAIRRSGLGVCGDEETGGSPSRRKLAGGLGTRSDIERGLMDVVLRCRKRQRQNCGSQRLGQMPHPH